VQAAGTTAGKPTVQGQVEAALGRVLRHPVRVLAAGRTDAGVHAEHQVVAFDTRTRINAHGLERALSGWLPEDVWVVKADETSPDFDARRFAVRRWYRYAIWHGAQPPPAAWQGRCLVRAVAPDLGAMRRATQALPGRHDLAALATGVPPGTSTIRTIYAADWLELTPDLLIFEICADGFLKQMVRTIVGSLLWVGGGRWQPEQFSAALRSADRRQAGPSAPAHGLTLYRIDYPPEEHHGNHPENL
jgi:tRNA pseudouridine38-40 synthase